MRRLWGAALLAPLVAACPEVGTAPRFEAGAGGGGGGGAAPVAMATATPAPVAPAPVDAPRAWQADFAAMPAGRAPAGFVDVRSEGWTFGWLYDGGWRVQDGVLAVTEARTQPYEPLSFRRWDGTAFGPGGALPARYEVAAEARSLGGSMRFRGYGEVAIQVAYFDPTTYVEVLQTDQHLCLWEAREAPPMQGKGWRLLGRVERPAAPGDWVRLTARVDRAAGTIEALADGQVLLRGTSPLLAPDREPRLTIRATGNRGEWRSLGIRALE